MFDEYIKQLRQKLNDLGYTDTENVIIEIENKYTKLLESGMSEDDILSRLGDVDKLAYSITGKEVNSQNKSKAEEPKTMASIYLTDALFYTPGIILSIAGIIATAFCSGLCGYTGFLYAYKSWVDPIFVSLNDKVFAFVMSLLAIIVSALGIWLSIILVKKTIKGSKKYFNDRKIYINKIKGVNND